MKTIEKIKDCIAFIILGLVSIIVVGIVGFVIYIGSISVYNLQNVQQFYKDVVLIIGFVTCSLTIAYTISWAIKRVFLTE